MANYKPLLNRLSIRTKNFSVEPLRLNWAQRAFVDQVEATEKEGKPVRIIVLKARQLGISTITEGLMFVRAFVFPGSHGLVVAHEQDSSEHLFGMTHLYWETWPWKELWTPKYANRKELTWRENGSSIQIATAKNVRAGRGRTIMALHGSEVAFWDRPEQLMTGLRQTVPNTPQSMIVLESTAQGVGNYFYNVWQAASAGDVEYVPLFFPWWRHPEYVASNFNLREPLRKLDAEETILHKIGCDEDHLMWRRWAIRNLCENDIGQFHQEYPSTPEEAFVVSGTNVYPLIKLRDAFVPEKGVNGYLIRNGDHVDFKPDGQGPLTVFRKPHTNKEWGTYFVGGDPTRSTTGDFACAQVINRRTYEQVAVYRRKIDPMTFGEELAKLGSFYNDAVISTEVEGPGYATIGRLIEIDYPRLWHHHWADKAPGKIADTYGWSTTWKRKEWAIGFMLKLIVDSDLIIHDQHTFQEMRDYVTLPSGGYGPADGANGHDDTVMSLAIACICSATEGPLLPYEGNPMPEGRYTGPGKSAGNKLPIDVEPTWMSHANV